MGLKKSYETNYGITAENAYHRILNPQSHSDGTVFYTVEVYYDYDARQSGSEPLTRVKKRVPNELKSKLGVVHEIYEVLKKDIDYQGAEDIYEPGYFPGYSNSYLANGYIVSAFLTQGSLANGNLSNCSIEGKCIFGEHVIAGTFTGVNAQNILVDGYGELSRGWIADGYADGYAVQLLNL